MLKTEYANFATIATRADSKEALLAFYQNLPKYNETLQPDGEINIQVSSLVMTEYQLKELHAAIGQALSDMSAKVSDSQNT